MTQEPPTPVVTGSAPVEFQEFPKMARLTRDCLITEKIDGTNAQILITEDGGFYTGSRTRWITPSDDNHGFSRWAHEHKDCLMGLGVGRHFGEWWGSGVQRGYGLQKGEKRFGLFNVSRWVQNWKDGLRAPLGEGQGYAPECCHVVPLLYRGTFSVEAADHYLKTLKEEGSRAAPGFMKPEGIVVFHIAAQMGFKKTIEKDEVPKSLAQAK